MFSGKISVPCYSLLNVNDLKLTRNLEFPSPVTPATLHAHGRHQHTGRGGSSGLLRAHPQQKLFTHFQRKMKQNAKEAAQMLSARIDHPTDFEGMFSLCTPWTLPTDVVFHFENILVLAFWWLKCSFLCEWFCINKDTIKNLTCGSKYIIKY